MYKIGKKLEYSMVILKHMDSRCVTELTTPREIEAQYNLPYDTSAKVMQQMSQAGVLKSIQGVKGGYQLASSLKELSFYQLVEIIEGKRHLTRCLGGQCDIQSTCNITGVVNRLNGYIHHFFHGLTVADLFAPNPLQRQLNE
jgi:Rrf2 family protein